MKFNEAICPKCKNELMATSEDLICTNCNNWTDITSAKIVDYKKLIIKLIGDLNEISLKLSPSKIFWIVLNLVEIEIKELQDQILDLENGLSKLEKWVGYSIYLSIVKEQIKEFDNTFIEIGEKYAHFLSKLQQFQKNILILFKLKNGNLKIFKTKLLEEKLVIPPDKPIYNTPIEILNQQNKKS